MKLMLACMRLRTNVLGVVGLIGMLELALPIWVKADTPSPGDSAKASTSPLEIRGFVDIAVSYNTNEPVDNANFYPGVGTSGKRDHELSLTMAQVSAILPPAPVGFNVTLGYGTATEVVHAAEVTGVATSPDVWRNVVQASVQWQTKLGRGLLFEAGVYPSHIGMESFATKDNWNYTRSWLGELSPYYQTGLMAAYPLSDRWLAHLHLLNGWQMIGDVNNGKSVGGKLAYSFDRGTVSINGIFGPELPDNEGDKRSLVDVVALMNVHPSVALGLSADWGREGRPSGDDADWAGVGLYARLAPPESRTALALRGEYYEDTAGAISGASQILKEVTATLEHRPIERLIFKLEGRYDHSTAAVFSDDALDAKGEVLRAPEQTLFLLGMVVMFP